MLHCPIGLWLGRLWKSLQGGAEDGVMVSAEREPITGVRSGVRAGSGGGAPGQGVRWMRPL